MTRKTKEKKGEKGYSKEKEKHGQKFVFCFFKYCRKETEKNYEI